MSTSLCAIVGLVLIAGVATSDLHAPIQQNDDVREYCLMETFQPRCTHGDVISMTSAMFGRMRVGRCIAPDAFQLQNPDTLGCSANVLGYFDRVCSGKSSCDVVVPNPDLYSYRPCSAHLTTYLEASFVCVSVVDEDRSCSILASVGTPIYVSNSPKRTKQGGDNLRCGSASNPWIVEAQTGQQITVSMIDFAQRQDQTEDVVTGKGVSSKHETSVENQQCSKRYGYIVDKAMTGASANRRNTTICASASVAQRVRFVYQSKGSLVEVVLTSTIVGSESNQNNNFLLGFEAVGCSNLVPPVDAWLRRTDNEATVGCYTTRQRWHLRCEDGQWKGTIGQCHNTELPKDTTGLDVLVASVKSEDTTVLKMSALLAVSFVGLAVCLVIIFVGVGCSQRYKRQMSTLKAGQYPSMPRTQQHVSKMVNLGPHTNENIGFTSTDARHQYFILDKEITANDIVGVDT